MPSQPLFGIPVMVGMSLAVMAMRKVRSACEGKGAAMMRVEAARRMMPSIWFNEKTTEGGREALGWYHEKKDEVRGIGLGPDHDWSSHSFDAFGLMCVAYEEPKVKAAAGRKVAAGGWMGR